MYKDIFESIRNEAEKRNLRERTIQLYCSDVSYFLRWIGKNVSDLTLEDAESFLTAKRLEGRSPETHNHYRSAIKFLYKKVLKTVWDDDTVPAMKRERNLPAVLSRAEINADGSVPEEQWEKIGCAYPDATLSWSNTFRYKKFDLSFSLRASIGGEILNNYAMEYENLSSIGLRNISSNWLSQTNFTSTTYKYSSKYIEDASYLKLDNVTFGYTWDFTSKMIKRLRLSLTAQNVFCITGYSGVDPEVALSGLEPGMESLSYYPRTTEFTFGVNIVF